MSFAESIEKSVLRYNLSRGTSDRFAKPSEYIYETPGDSSILTFQSPDNGAVRASIVAPFLPYIVTKATVCPGSVKGGVLSGPFSGCWFVRFLKKGSGGGHHAAHIGTGMSGGDNSPSNSKLKKAFVEYAEKNDISIVLGYNAHHCWTQEEINKMSDGKQGNAYNLGYIDTYGIGYSIFLVKTGAQPRSLQVARSWQVESKPYNFPKQPELKSRAIDKQEDLKNKARRPEWSPQTGDLPIGLVEYAVMGVRVMDVVTWPDLRQRLLEGTNKI